MTDVLRFSPHIEWNSEEKPAGPGVINFIRSGKVIVTLQASQQLCHFLDDIAQGNVRDQSHPLFDKFIKFLQSRKILLSAGPCCAVVRIFLDGQTIFCCWELAAEKNLTIDILVGDEVSLMENFTNFLAARSAESLIGYIKVRAARMDLGPLRFPYEVQWPTTRSRYPLRYPSWRERFTNAAHVVRELFDECLNTPRWYNLTAKGFTKSWIWQEASSPYHLETSLVTSPKDCAHLVFYQAQIENGIGSGGGVSDIAADAEFQASCEAWERYCMARPDLALKAEHGDNVVGKEGIYFDFLRTLTTPIPKARPFCLATSLDQRKTFLVPTQWVYFHNDTSPTNTSGTAFGSHFEEACLSARLELIERHLLMKVYLGLSGAQEIKVSLDDFAFVKDFVQDKKRTIHWYNLGSANNANVVVCIVSSTTPPYASLGAAARFSIHDAARKALYEALAVDLLWSSKIGQFGPRQFLTMGQSFMDKSPSRIGLEEGAWIWAAMPDACAILHGIFHAGTPSTSNLSEENFLAIDMGENILPYGSVVKLLHPDALPLPSYYSHTLMLCNLLNAKHPLPLPMT